eukprot:TRINITY_DN31148_c0_g1_i1.p1 TRINITY_DN31148_c0_g1~~TRINITY_DN31148_c0_g1_i1.p1  ORF type:complete len:419 (+),score=94.09 TRINITY_DN31148_c0_g1_i1:132-1259(+)
MEAEGEALAGQAPDDTDNANYFCEYAYLYHQMDMLEDSHRTGSYHQAIVSNPSCFEGKVVMDVGAGTCILSIFAARAGAAKVFAVEATDMASRGRRIVEANGLSEVITVIQGTVETVNLPCKVDIIVSEWMGYFLLRERMLDSVLHARDRFLKPGGVMFPSHANLYLAPLGACKVLSDKAIAWEQERTHWANFSEEMQNSYETDFSCMADEFMAEQRKYYLQTGTFVNLTSKCLAGPGRPLLEMDLHTVTLAELLSPEEPYRCSMRVVRDGPLEGFVGYFDTPFKGNAQHPVEQEVTLTTAPSPSGQSTHWGQQIFGFYPPLQAKRGDTLDCSMFIRRQAKNHRLLWLEADFELCAQQNGTRVVRERRKDSYYVD